MSRRAVAFIALVISGSAGCQYPLLLVIANTTDEAINVSLRLADSESSQCLQPHRLSYMPASHVGRRFREPERGVVREAAFDPTLCSVRGKIPPRTALELEFSSAVYRLFFENEIDGELSVQGSAGAIVLRGSQIRHHLHEQSGSLVLEYGSAA